MQNSSWDDKVLLLQSLIKSADQRFSGSQKKMPLTTQNQCVRGSGSTLILQKASDLPTWQTTTI